jgi:hypothetical protein
MVTFDRFLAVVGFFRSSGYFKLRKELGDISEIKILVGINIDDIFRKHNKALLMLADEEKAKFICETRGQMLVEITPVSLAAQPFTAKYNLNGKRYNGADHFEDLVNC